VTFGVPGNRHVSLIKNMQVRALADGTKRRITEIWHADSSWDKRPPTHAFLHAKVLPDVGGDTLFANQCAAFDGLSPAMQKMLSSLRAVHRTPQYRFDEGSGTEAVHPVITTHPETGRKVLYVNLSATREFEGMTAQESRGLLEFLFDHQVRPEFVYRHRWALGDVVMWDNRCTLHYAVNDYEDAPRELVRVSIVGPPPAA
jgi:taurine dioxygenase